MDILLEMLEDLHRKKRVKSKQDQLASSFNIVRQIQKETDPDELLEIYNALKNETNVDHENLAVLSAQVALFSRFAFLAARQDGYRLACDDRVVTATGYLANCWFARDVTVAMLVVKNKSISLLWELNSIFM